MVLTQDNTEASIESKRKLNFSIIDNLYQDGMKRETKIKAKRDQRNKELTNMSLLSK